MANPFKDVGGEIFSTVFSGVLWFGIALIVISVVGFFMWYFLFYKKKFDIQVKIISQRADDRNKIIFDKAAILKDRESKTPYFRIWGLKKDLPVPRFNVLQSSSTGDYLELLRTSEDNIFFLTPSLIDKKIIVRSDGVTIGIAAQEAKQMETDVAYWQSKRKIFNKKMFDTESMVMKLLPYIPHIMGGVIMIFILYILLDHLPGILSQLQKLYELNNAAYRADITTGLTMALHS